VVATAPEVMLVARLLRAVAPRLRDRGIDLIGQVRAVDACAAGLSEQRRVGLRQRCPFVARGVCAISRVRPLACRGHASHDALACADAAAGRRPDVPYSTAHRMVRAMVQNAMQSSLREAGLAWGNYELNRALLLSRDDPTSERAWLDGRDVLAPAAPNDVPAQEMTAVYDELRPHADSDTEWNAAPSNDG
jgi:hypothetical protein